MPNLKIETSGHYKADDLYQWDLNQSLFIYGLTVKRPILHFTIPSMKYALVVHPNIDKAGVINCVIPNSFLQKTESITVYVCGYEGPTFKTYYRFDLKVKARQKPADYKIEADDNEIYSFVALEQKVIDSLKAYDEKYYNSHNILEARVKTAEMAVEKAIEDVSKNLDDLSEERDKLKTELQSFENRVSDKTDYVTSHVTPWNTENNVGLITAETWSCDLKSNVSSSNGQTGIVTETLAVPMINSGKIKLHIPYKFTRHGYSSKTDDNTFIKVCVNDVVIHTIPYPSDILLPESGGVSYSNTATISLSVKKGDILSIISSANCTGSTSSDIIRTTITDLGLFANIETPFKYLSLSENLDSPTLDEVINALVGE